jgi:uncharacterized protein YqeY
VAIFDEVSEQLTQALRSRDAARLVVLRSVRAAFLNEIKKDGSSTLSNEACIEVLRRLEKQRRESIEAFRAAQREDRAEAEVAELGVIQSFLPSLADEQTTRSWLQEAIQATGAGSARDIGRVMGALMKTRRGEVDGNLARKLAQELLDS